MHIRLVSRFVLVKLLSKKRMTNNPPLVTNSCYWCCDGPWTPFWRLVIHMYKLYIGLAIRDDVCRWERPRKLLELCVAGWLGGTWQSSLVYLEPLGRRIWVVAFSFWKMVCVLSVIWRISHVECFGQLCGYMQWFWMYFKGITGTTSALITGGLHILRAVNEEAYRVDRMFTHLRSASGDQLHKLEALVLGDFDRALQDVLKNGTSILSFFHTPAESLGFCERELKLVRRRGIWSAYGVNFIR